MLGIVTSNFICRWMFKLSEWAHVSSYDVGLNSGSSAHHIVVYFPFLFKSAKISGRKKIYGFFSFEMGTPFL